MLRTTPLCFAICGLLVLPGCAADDGRPATALIEAPILESLEEVTAQSDLPLVLPVIPGEEGMLGGGILGEAMIYEDDQSQFLPAEGSATADAYCLIIHAEDPAASTPTVSYIMQVVADPDAPPCEMLEGASRFESTRGGITIREAYGCGDCEVSQLEGVVPKLTFDGNRYVPDRSPPA